MVEKYLQILHKKHKHYPYNLELVNKLSISIFINSSLGFKDADYSFLPNHNLHLNVNQTRGSLFPADI